MDARDSNDAKIQVPAGEHVIGLSTTHISESSFDRTTYNINLEGIPISLTSGREYYIQVTLSHNGLSRHVEVLLSGTVIAVYEGALDNLRRIR
jgi:hypothetical protein